MKKSTIQNQTTGKDFTGPVWHASVVPSIYADNLQKRQKNSNLRSGSNSGIRLLPLVLIAIGQGLHAQQIPNAGNQIQQIPPAPIQQRAPPEISIQRGVAPAQPGTEDTKILVRVLRVTGAQVYSEAELIALTASRPETN